MDFRIITIMALIIMASGKPVEEKIEAKSPQAQLHSPSTTASSGLSKSPQSASDMSGVSESSITTVSGNSATTLTPTEYHSLSSNQHASSNPGVILDNPATSEFINVECNSSSSLILKQQSDPVQSDFSASKLADIPELEEITSGSEMHRLFSPSANKLRYSNKPSSGCVTKLKFQTEIISSNRVTEKFVKNEDNSFATNDFELVAQEEIDPVQSDFLVNHLSNVLAAGAVTTNKPYSETTTAANGFVNVTSDTASTPNKPVAEEIAFTTAIVNIEKPVTEQTVTTATSSDEIGLSNNSASGQVEVVSNINKQESVFGVGSSDSNLEVDNRAKDQVLATISNIVNDEKTFTENSTVSSDLAEEPVPSGIQKEQINVASQSKGGQILSGGDSVPSSSGNGQEPITVVTAITFPVASSSVNGQEPVTIVWANKSTMIQFQNQPLGVANRPMEGQISSAGISVSSSSPNEQKPVTVVSSPQLQNGQVPYSGISDPSSSGDGQRPVTEVIVVTPTQIQSQAVDEELSGTSVFSSTVSEQKPITVVSSPQLQDGQMSLSGISVSSSSVNEQQPVTVVSVVTPTPIQNQDIDEELSGTSVFTSSINEQKLVSSPQLHKKPVPFLGISVSSSSVDGQRPVTEVNVVTPTQIQSEAVDKEVSGTSVFNSTVSEQKPVTSVRDPQLQNEQVSFSGISVSSSSVDWQQPVTEVSVVTPSQIQSEAVDNELSGTSVFSSSINEQKPVTSVSSPQLQNEQVPFSGISVSNSSVDGQRPVTVISVVTPTQIQNQDIDEELSGTSVFSSSVNEQKPVTVVRNPQLQNGQASFSGISVSSSSVNGHKPITVVKAINPTQIQNQGGQIALTETSISNTSINDQALLTLASEQLSELEIQEANKFLESFSKPQLQNEHVSISGVSASSSSVNGKEPITVVSSFNPVFVYNQQANKSIGNQISVGSSIFSSSINGQKPATIINNPQLENGQTSFAGISVSSNSVNRQKPVTVVSTINPTQIQNQAPLIGTYVSSSSINGHDPVTVVSSSNAVSGIISEKHNQEANKPIESQISVGSSMSSSSINGQNPIILVSKPQLQNEQDGNMGVFNQMHNQFFNRPMEGHMFPSLLGGNHQLQNGQGGSMGVFNPMQNHFFNNPMGGQMFPSSYNGLVDQQPSNAGFPNQIKDQLAINIPNGPDKPAIVVSKPQLQNEQVSISGVTVSSSSSNGKEPVTVVTAINPTQMQNQVVGAPVSLIGTSVSTSSINGQDPVTVVSSVNPVSGMITEIHNHQANQSIESQISTGSSVSSSSINGQKSVTVINNPQLQNGQASFSGVSVSSNSVNGHKPVTVVSSSNPVSGIMTEKHNQEAKKPIESQISVGSSMSSSSINEQKPITVISKPQLQNEVFNQMHNQFFNRPMGGQMFPSLLGDNHQLQNGQNQFFNNPMGGQIFPSFNDLNNQQSSTAGFVNQMKDQLGINMANGPDKPATVVSKPQLQNEQVSNSGITVSSSFINGKDPVTVVSSFNPVPGLISEIHNQQAHKSTESQISAVSSASSSSINGQKPVTVINTPQLQNGQSFSGVTVSSNSVNGHNPVTVVNSINPTQIQNQVVGGQVSLIGTSVSSSSINGKDPVAVVSSFNPVSGIFSGIQNQQAAKPIESQISVGSSVSSSSINGQKPVTTVSNSQPQNGQGSNMEVFNQMQNQFFNRPMGGQMFPFGGFLNQQQSTTGFVNQIKDQFPINMANQPAGQVFVGSSIESSSSSDGQKTQTTVTSTDNLTGKVTQTKYESSGGKPVTVFQTISSTVDGEKAQTVVTSKNPITGEVTKTKYESSLKNHESDDHSGAETANNVTNHAVTQTSKDSVNNNGREEIIIFNPPVKSEKMSMAETTKPNSIEGNFPENNVSYGNVPMASVGTIKFVGDNLLNEAVGLRIPNTVEGGQISLRIIVSTNRKRPVTIITTKNPSIGASTQTKYVVHPIYNNYPELIPQNVMVTPDTSLPSKSSPMKEMTWIKRTYSIANPFHSWGGELVPSSLCNGQNSKPVASSTNSLIKKINQAKYVSSGVNVANVPVNIRLFLGMSSTHQQNRFQRG